MIDAWVAAIAIASVVAYITIASFVWALFPSRWREPEMPVGAIAFVWPITAAVLVVILMMQIGPRTVAWYRRPRLPKAKVRK